MMGLDGLNGSKVTSRDIGYFVFFKAIWKKCGQDLLDHN